MSLSNADIYERNPLQEELANAGVAQVTPKEDEDLASYEKTLRFELQNFVCNGEYKRGMELLLDRYLTLLRSGNGPVAAWLSGFYGAGKSHLAKMLAVLWTNYRFADGTTAMQVAVHLPDSVRDLLVELHNESKKHGGLHAAAGLLSSVGAGDALGTVLGVVFRSRGLPAQVFEGRFVLWLKEQGYYDAVRKAVDDAGKEFDSAVHNMVGSREIRETLVKCDSGLGTDAEVRELLRRFANDTEVSIESFKRDVERALKLGGGQIPLTLLVLDEVQQFIGTDVERTLQIQHVAETCNSSFQGRVQLLATGQAEMGSTPELQKLKGRFPVDVHLTDNDVEGVIRQTVLAKNIKHRPKLDAVMSAASGEVSRHLSGTRIAPNTKDTAVLLDDYPILPSRRRFFEAVLRAMDASGGISQLRNQLRIAYEAARETGKLPLGNVIGGDFIFDELQASNQFHKLCPVELSNKIRALAGASDDDEQLMGRLMKLIFVINKLPHGQGQDLGVRATVDALADLLITDLTRDSASLRARVPGLLKRLEDEHHLVMALQQDGVEVYRENTKESQTWLQEYTTAENELRGNAARIGIKRNELLKGYVQPLLDGITKTQGAPKEPRKQDVRYEANLPADASTRLTVWVQDGWSVTQKSFEGAATAAGMDSPTLFVFIPEKSKSDLNDAIISLKAAEQTLATKGVPSTTEGREARKMMEHRQWGAQKRIDDIIKEAVDDALVYSGGGSSVDGDSLVTKVSAGLDASIPRLFSRFGVADHKDWPKAFDKARLGVSDALAQVGHTADADKHPVCKELLDFFGTAGKRGAEAQARFEAAPYGWPRDAIQAATLALVANGYVKAKDASGNLLTAKQIERNQFTKILFACESVQVTVAQKLQVTRVLKAAGINCNPGEEHIKVGLLGRALHELRLAAGGEAPKPVAPDATLIGDIESKSGNDQLVYVASKEQEIRDAITSWTAIGKSISDRLPGWQQLQQLMRYVDGLSGAEAWKADMQAVVDQRGLLLATDPVVTLRNKVEPDLRSAVLTKAAAYQKEYDSELRALEGEALWQQLPEADRDALLAQASIPQSYKVDAGSTAGLLESLGQCDLRQWDDRIAALAGRFGKLLDLAAKKLAPKSVPVHLSRPVLRTEQEVRDWVRDVEQRLLAAVKTNPVQVQ